MNLINAIMSETNQDHMPLPQIDVEGHRYELELSQNKLFNRS
jgi:hypothetical protein